MRLLLQNCQAPGDVLMLTAAVRDLHRAYPGRFRTAVESSCPELWLHNRNVVTPARLGPPDRIIRCEYPLVHESNRRPFHFLHGFVQDLEQKLDLRIPVTEFKGDVHLSDEEMRAPSPVETLGWRGKYWVVVAGGKFDFTTKWWNPDSFQEVIDHFRGRIRFVQCGESGHRHPPLRHVLDLVGQTTLRDFIQIVYWADGVICPVTFAMHLAAAVPGRKNARLKPCIVIAGGREPPHWETYPGHQFLHTIGALECCATGGCWKSRCQPMGDGDEKDRSLCERPVRVRDDLQLAQCMTLVTPARVIEAVELYIEASKMNGINAEEEFPHKLDVASAGVSSEIKVRSRAVAVTIATGPFEPLGALAAREFRARTGLETVILGPREFVASRLESPLFLKFRLFDLIDVENVVYFDADIVCLERWDPRRCLDREPIIAVGDRMGPEMRDEAERWDVPPAEFFNAGFFIANRRHHVEWLRLAETIRFERPTGQFDQSPLNSARRRLGLSLKLLDRRFNWLGFGSSVISHEMPVVMAHKLAPGRLDLNRMYFDGKYELMSPSVTLDEAEADLVAGRTLTWTEEGSSHEKLTFREDGTLIARDGCPNGYWFVQLLKGRPTLALASETRVCKRFVEVVGGDWISNDGGDVRLVDETRHLVVPVTEQTARQAAERFIKCIPPYPTNRYSGRGIVICGGGERYLPSAWICIQMLRRLGSQLPIELWQLRRSEIPDAVRERLRSRGVRCVSAAEVRRQHPVRHLGGWELKPYSILHSAFEQVLYLDADNMAVVDPTHLFETEEFRKSGAVFWPDYGRLAPDRMIWQICGVPYRDEPEFESGQILVDKRQSWRALHLTMHLNEHSDLYYRHIHGDKETFHIAWRMLDQPYEIVPHHIVGLAGVVMCQHGFDGRRIFQHRNLAKWTIGTNRRIAGFEREGECLEFLRELEELWRPESQ